MRTSTPSSATSIATDDTKFFLRLEEAQEAVPGASTCPARRVQRGRRRGAGAVRRYISAFEDA
jgi:hypothetical protein